MKERRKKKCGRSVLIEMELGEIEINWGMMDNAAVFLRLTWKWKEIVNAFVKRYFFIAYYAWTIPLVLARRELSEILFGYEWVIVLDFREGDEKLLVWSIIALQVLNIVISNIVRPTTNNKRISCIGNYNYLSEINLYENQPSLFPIYFFLTDTLKPLK